MKIEITKRFVKDTQKITDKRILLKIQQVLLDAQKIENLICMNDLEEM